MSREFSAASEAQLKALCERRLEGLAVLIVYIHGIRGVGVQERELLKVDFITEGRPSMENNHSKKPGIAPTPPPTLLTVREVSEYLRVHPTTIYRLLHLKQIPGFRVGSDWRFSVEAIDRWRSGEEQAGASAPSGRKTA